MGPAGMVLDLVAEFVMGSVCQGQSLSWAEFVMGRDFRIELSRYRVRAGTINRHEKKK